MYIIQAYLEVQSLTFDSTSTIKSSLNLINQGGQDIFILKYNKTGTLQWAKGYGSPNNEYASWYRRKK